MKAFGRIHLALASIAMMIMKGIPRAEAVAKYGYQSRGHGKGRFAPGQHTRRSRYMPNDCRQIQADARRARQIAAGTLRTN